MQDLESSSVEIKRNNTAIVYTVSTLLNIKKYHEFLESYSDIEDFHDMEDSNKNFKGVCNYLVHFANCQLRRPVFVMFVRQRIKKNLEVEDKIGY